MSSSAAQPSVRIRTATNGSRAVLESLLPKNQAGAIIEMEDVRNQLTLDKVINGIHWSVIESAVLQTGKTGQPVRNILIAEAIPGTDPSVFLGGDSTPCSSEEREAWESAGRWVAGAFAATSFDSPPEEIRFVISGEELYSRKEGTPGVDVFGRILASRTTAHRELHPGAGVEEVTSATHCIFVARQSGYLAINSGDQLFIQSPLLPDSNRMLLHLVLLPVTHGSQELIRFALETLAHEPALKEIMPSEEALKSFCLTSFASRTVERIPVRKGRPSVPGEPGRLIWHVDLTGKPPGNIGEEQVNYASFSPYRDVAEGALILEIRKPGAGTPGLDVLGAIIPSAAGEEILAPAAADFVATSESTEAIIYRAARAGIAQCQANQISVVESLIIRGHVGPETGNLHCDTHIQVQGDILGGYHVVCGGNLTVSGSIEVGVHIDCGGDLTLTRGLYGKKSYIHVRGNADIGFIQDGRIRVLGNLLVRDYIQDSKVFCRGTLTVEGRSVRGNRRGAVMGGRISAMDGMVLHSLGTPLGPTSAVCGVDDLVLKRLREVDQLLPILVNRMARLQSALGFDPASPDARRFLASVSAARKVEIKALLLELRTAGKQREDIQASRVRLLEKAFAPVLETVHVSVNNHLVPFVALHIEAATLSVTVATSRRRFFLREGRIHSEALTG